MQNRAGYILLFYRSTIKIAVATSALVAMWQCISSPAGAPAAFLMSYPVVGLGMDGFYRFLSKKRMNEFHFYRMGGLGVLELYGASLLISLSVSAAGLLLLNLCGL